MDGHGRTDGWMDGSGSLSPSLSLLDYDERGEATFVLLLLVSLSLSLLPIRNDKVRGSREKLTTNLA